MHQSSEDTPHLPDHRSYDLLDRWLAGGLTPPEEAEARRVASALFARPDDIELIHEIAVEEGMLRMLLDRAHAEDGSKATSIRTRNPAGRALPVMAREPRRLVARRRWYASGVRAAAVLIVAVSLAALGAKLARSWAKGREAKSVMVATLPGQHITVELPDGSGATLAPNSELRYTISPDRGPREISLDGEAYFEVRHDRARPFRVRTASAVVEDLGTTFAVRQYSADSRARVAVRSGAVAIHPRDVAGAVATRLRAGQAVDIDANGSVVRLTGDTTAYWSWTTGRLEFDGTPLPEVLARLARWYDVDFQLRDSTLNKQYFTGAFEAVSLPQALEILGPLVHASFEQQAREVIVTPRPGSR